MFNQQLMFGSYTQPAAGCLVAVCSWMFKQLITQQLNVHIAARYVSSWIGGILLYILGCGRHTDAIVIEPTVASVVLYMDSTQIAFSRHLPAL